MMSIAQSIPLCAMYITIRNKLNPFMGLLTLGCTWVPAALRGAETLSMTSACTHAVREQPCAQPRGIAPAGSRESACGQSAQCDLLPLTGPASEHTSDIRSCTMIPQIIQSSELRRRTVFGTSRCGLGGDAVGNVGRSSTEMLASMQPDT